MATFGGAMIDEEERPVDSGVIPKTYTTVRLKIVFCILLYIYP